MPIHISHKSPRKSRKVSRKSRKSPSKSRKVSRKSRKVSRKSRKVSRKSRKSSRKSRKSKKKSMSKNERRCKNLLKEKIGKNIKEYKQGIFKSIKQAIAVSYNQVKKMIPSCDKYLKKNN